MRKIEQAMLNAVQQKIYLNKDNTIVNTHDDHYLVVQLFNNPIYREHIFTGEKEFSLAGFNTMTTRSRLRALGIAVSQVKGLPMYNGEVIPTSGWIKV